MSLTVDTNVLVYASNIGDPKHEAASRLLDRMTAATELAYLFWPVLFGYLRIVTNSRIFDNPLTPAEALTNIEAMIARPHVRAAGGEAGLITHYREIGGEHTRGNVVPDAHLVALMRQYGVRTIHTEDRGFRRFEGIEVRALDS